MSYIRDSLERYREYDNPPSEKCLKIAEAFLDGVENRRIDTDEWEIFISESNGVIFEYGDEASGYVNIEFMPDGSTEYKVKENEYKNYTIDKLVNSVARNNKTFKHRK